MPEMKLGACWRRLAATALGASLAVAGLAPAAATPEGVVMPAFRGGTITIWGDASTGQDQLPASLTGKTVTAVAPGPGHILAVTTDGRVTAWGAPGDGRTTVPAGLATKTAAAVAAGGFHSMALTSDGAITAWGRNDLGQATVPPSLAGKTATAIAAGYNHSLALTSDGAVTAWGSNLDARATVPASLTGKTVTAIAAGGGHSLALTSDGAVTGWGRNVDGQTTIPAGLTGKTVTAIAAGWDHSVALTSDGTVTAWGSADFAKTTVPASLAGKKVTAIASGDDHILAVTSDGTITAWGRNGLGQATVPAGLTGKIVTAVAADGALSLALATGFAAEGAPVVTGSAVVRGTLTAASTRYTAEPDAVAYQWYADGVAIVGATASTYTVTMAEVGKQLTVRVTATKAGHPPVVTTSTPLGPVAGSAPALQLAAATATLRRGQSTALTWNSADATSLAATGGWTGPRNAVGTIEVRPTAIGTATYVLAATNAQGTTTAQVQVQVTRPAKRLKVAAPKGRHPAGTKVKVTVRGLEPGEKYTIRIGKKKVTTGTAKNARPAVRKIKLPTTPGRATVRVTGDQPDRTGIVKVRVVRR